MLKHLILIAVLIGLCRMGAPVAAQTAEPFPEATATVVAPEQPAIVPTLDGYAPDPGASQPTISTDQNPGVPIGDALGWFISLILVWQTLGTAISVTYEQTVKRAINTIIEAGAPAFLRVPLIVVGVVISAYLLVSNGNINLLADAPYPFIRNGAPGFLLALNTALVAAGAFITHEQWDRIILWLRRFKSAGEIMLPPTPG